MNKVSVWQIDKLYYIYFDDFDSYFAYCYKYKNKALKAAEKLKNPPRIVEFQIIKNHTKCIVLNSKN